MSNKAVILSGISGSGKSSYIRSISERVWYPHFKSGDVGGAVVVSADHYFMNQLEGKYEFDFKKLSNAHGSCFRYFIELVQYRSPLIIVDNTSCDNMEISPYVLGAQAYDYDVEVVTLVCPSAMGDDEYVRRCAERNSHNVPESGIRAQYERLCNRQLPPWWNRLEVESKF
jgi:predicted ABC-type ATPase